MSSETAIKVENLSKCYEIYQTPRDRLKQFALPRVQRLIGAEPSIYYKEFWALKDITFEIKKGETVGIVGRNGSGKSTLLQTLCGTLNPTTGNVETNGRIAALLELGSGFNPEFTGRENIYLNGALLGLSRTEIDAKFNAILAFANIGDFIDQPVKTYSSGMFVRLAFSIQANVDPEILIIDEALAVGDAYFVHRCMLRFNELRKAGTTILFVSHDANAVRNLCERALWIADGQIKKDGDSAKVVDSYLAHLFGRNEIESRPSDTSLDNTKNTNDGSLEMETTIPNIDRRLGDQKCVIIGVGLYNESLSRIASTSNEKNIILRMTFRNQSLSPEHSLVIGYIFRNTKGQEIASTNSQIDHNPIPYIPEGDSLTVRMKIAIPCLHPGSYAFSLTLGYNNSMGEIILSDRIDNAITLDLLTTRQVNVLMNFPTIFELEE